MSKQMTPCEKLGYKVGDRFTVVEKSYMFNVGDMAILQSDDGSSYPFFTNDKVKEVYPKGVTCFLTDIKPIAKLKPAKQALADAIHNNGGWLIAGDYSFVTSNRRGVVKFFHQKPRRHGVNWVGGSCSLAWVDLHQQLPNWHQAMLSRDEYFTAYPEHVKVEVNNETEHKVEVEMKSESEITIKVSDWHKNGELPPVGEVCEAHITSENIWVEIEVVAHMDGFALGWCRNEKCGYHGDENSDFRPLRAERDKAIDEMIGIVLAVMNSSLQRRLCEDLYDAGYRKEVK